MKEIVIKTKVEGGDDIKKVSNAYSDLVKQIKVAKGELASLSDKVDSPAYKKAAANLNDLQEKLGDVQDTAKITGNGVERVGASFNLLKEGINTADFGKAKAAFTGLGSAMKAIPIFLLIEGIKLLIENFDEVVKFISAFTEAGKANAQAIREVNFAYETIIESLKQIQFYEKEYLRNSQQTNELLIESLKQKGAKDKEIRDAEIKGKKDALNTIIKAEENYRQQRDYAEAQHIKALKTNDEEAIKNAKTALEEADAAYKASIDKRKDYSNSLVLQEQKNITATLEEQKEKYQKYLQNQKDINDKLKQLQQDRYLEEVETTIIGINNIYDEKKKNLIENEQATNVILARLEYERFAQIFQIEKEKEVKLEELKYNALKKGFKDKHASTEELKKIDDDYIITKLKIDSKYNGKVIEQQKILGDTIAKTNIENEENLNKTKKDFNKKVLEEQLKFAQLKGEKTYSIERQLLLIKHEDELAILEQQKQKEIKVAKQLSVGAEDAILEIEEKYKKLHIDVKERQYKEEEKLLDKSVEATKKAEDEKLKKTMDNVNKIMSVFSQLTSTAMAIWQSIDELEDSRREARLQELEEYYDEQRRVAQEASDKQLYDLENSYNREKALRDYALAEMLDDENLSEEEKENIKYAARAREEAEKIAFENRKIQIQNEALKTQYELDLKLYNEQEKLKEAAFKQDQNMKVVQTIINTISGAFAAFTGMAQAIPGPYGLIAGAVAAAAVAALGAVQVANIKATKYQKGTPPSKPSFTPPVVGTGVPEYKPGGGSGAKTPKDSTLYGTGGVGGNGGPTSTPKTEVVINDGKPVQAYVLASDVSDALAAQEALKKKNTGF